MSGTFRSVAALALAAFALVPAAARADNASTVTFVGTSDVSDSGLVQNVLKPGFEAAYPQYTFNYSSMGTGAAITAARQGTASGLLVHAASLENQFVGDGYSNESYGRAVFYGDYVVLSQQSDPAGVGASDMHDVVSAFEKIATAGAAGNANFIGRGTTGSSAPPGTGVEEHLIWALTNLPSIPMCVVSDANGGGKRPYTGTNGDPCPAGNNAQTPGWYHETGSNQGLTADIADTCNFTGGNCYALLDRGTFQFKQSQNPPTATHLHIVTRDNSASARGGQDFLINSFHAYAINPAKFAGNGNVQLNTTGATAFLNWVTSPAAQAAVQAFLSGSGDAPFKGSAAPALSASGVPSTVTAGTAITVTGNLHNVVPGTPALSGQAVNLATPAGKVASTTANAQGNYSVTYTPTASAFFTVGTGQISQIENSSLNPVFGDLLNPTSTAVGSLTVQSVISVSSIATDYRLATVSGSVLPASDHKAAVVSVLTRKKGSTGAFTAAGSARVAGGTYSVPVKFAPGSYEVQTRFDDQGQVLSSVAATRTITVPGAATVKISHVTVKGKRVTLTGKLSPKPSTTGAYVRLLARKRATSGKTPSYKAKGSKVTIGKGRTSFTLRVNLSGHTKYQLRIEYVHKGHIDTRTSSTRNVTIR